MENASLVENPLKELSYELRGQIVERYDRMHSSDQVGACVISVITTRTLSEIKFDFFLSRILRIVWDNTLHMFRWKISTMSASDKSYQKIERRKKKDGRIENNRQQQTQIET